MNMKKIGLLCLALVLALGALGVGYATWTDQITVHGTVSTGSVCLEIEPTWAEVFDCPASDFSPIPDRNWSGWVLAPGATSCPPNHQFESKPCTDKNVAWMEFIPMTEDGTIIAEADLGTIPVEKLKVTIKNAYPHYLGRLTFHVCNCGTVPIKLKPVVIEQDDFIIIEYLDGGDQLEPGLCHEISLWIGVTQHQGHWVDNLWVVDDESYPMLEQGATIDPAFILTVEGVQFDQYP